MAIIGNLPGERLAGLAADTFHKVQHGIISLDEWALFNQRKNPFAFERNDHGHIIVTVTGLDLNGAQEIERLEAAGYRLSDLAKSCLLSTAADGYDAMHTLVPQHQYQVALMPGKEIARDSLRTPENLRNTGIKTYGYGKPLGGIMPRIRERISDRQMEDMGFRYIAGLHDPIEDSGGDPRVLYAHRLGGGPWVYAGIDRPGRRWDDGGAFAFLVPASMPSAPVA